MLTIQRIFSFSFFKKIILSFVLLIFLSCQKTTKNKQISSDRDITINAGIDNFINKTKNDYGVPGIALAIIKDGEIIHHNNYGFANLEHQVKITDSSTFRLYSLTKPIIATAVFQLIEKGKLGLEDYISKYISDLPEKWKNIQIKHLLSFSSGLPELIEPYNEVKDLKEDAVIQKVFKVTMRFKTGDSFEYNQTNFWLIQKIIEEVTASKLSDFIIKNQFNGSSDTAYFSSDARDIIKNRVTPYFPFDKGVLTITHPYYQGDYSHGMNGLHLTLNHFIEWDKNFAENQLITQDTKTNMWSEFTYKNDDVFTHGWGKYIYNKVESYGFSGSGSTVYRTFPNERISIIYLSNGFSKNYDLNKVVDSLFAIITNTNN